jgi:hypothetical protein
MPHDQWVIKEIREEIKKLLEFNESEIPFRIPIRTYETQQTQS